MAYKEHLPSQRPHSVTVEKRKTRSLTCYLIQYGLEERQYDRNPSVLSYKEMTKIFCVFLSFGWAWMTSLTAFETLCYHWAIWRHCKIWGQLCRMRRIPNRSVLTCAIIETVSCKCIITDTYERSLGIQTSSIGRTRAAATAIWHALVDICKIRVYTLIVWFKLKLTHHRRLQVTILHCTTTLFEMILYCSLEKPPYFNAHRWSKKSIGAALSCVYSKTILYEMHME